MERICRRSLRDGLKLSGKSLIIALDGINFIVDSILEVLKLAVQVFDCLIN